MELKEQLQHKPADWKTSDIPRHTGTACLRKIAKNLPAFLLHKINLGLRTKKQVCYALDLFYGTPLLVRWLKLLRTGRTLSKGQKQEFAVFG